MPMYTVKHRTLGNGVVTDIVGNYVTVHFDNAEKRFLVKGFDKFFEIYDDELKELVNQANKVVEAPKPTNYIVPGSPKCPHQHKSSAVGTAVYVEENNTNGLLGTRAQTIHFADMHQMFEIIGYIARQGRVGSFEAEVPADGRDVLFEKMFPGQTYRPIRMGDTPSGMPNKLSPQFRINFLDLTNCPQVLKTNMGQGNGGCVGRINKSGFVLMLVQQYGFRFGDRQNIADIRSIALKRGYVEDFERGLLL